MGTSGKFDGSEIPDSIIPYVGIRAWRVSQTLRGEDRFSSVYKNGIFWPVENRLEAVCIQPESVWQNGGPWAVRGLNVPEDPMKKLPKHDSPYGDCTCGIYALNSDLDQTEPTPWTPEAIIGIVLIWGRILEGNRGYRGQYAKIAAVWMDSNDPERKNLIQRMAELYQVPIITDLEGELNNQRHLQGL